MNPTQYQFIVGTLVSGTDNRRYYVNESEGWSEAAMRAKAFSSYSEAEAFAQTVSTQTFITRVRNLPESVAD